MFFAECKTLIKHQLKCLYLLLDGGVVFKLPMGRAALLVALAVGLALGAVLGGGELLTVVSLVTFEFRVTSESESLALAGSSVKGVIISAAY